MTPRPRPRRRPVPGAASWRRAFVAVLPAALLLCGCASATAKAPAVTNGGRRAPTTTSSSTAATTTTSPTATSSRTTTTVPLTTTTRAATAAQAAPVTSACPSGLAARLTATGTAHELVTVDTAGYSTSYATLTAWARQGPCWVAVFGPWVARIGDAGFSDHKAEGDGTTPTGAYEIGPVMYGNAINPGVSYGYHPLVCGDWWDEDPGSPQYNSFQHVACGQAPPFGGGSERLWQEATAYPSFAVIDYNTAPVTRGAGSAIFIHADVGGATAGCVSLPLGELDTLLRWLSPAASPLVVMGPDSEISRF